MDYSFTISCTACSAIRSFERHADDAQLANADVLAQATHSHGCPRAREGNGAVSIDASNAANVVYTIS